MRKTRPLGGSGSFFGSSKPSSNQNESTSQNYYNSSTQRASGGLKKYIVIIIVLAIGYFIFSNMGGITDSPIINETGFNNSDSDIINETSSVDRGAYEVDRRVSELARDKRTVLIGDGSDRATIMVYLLGTDLESRSGMATMDLQEMLDADISPNVNIVIETGGTSQWKNDVISSKTNQRYLINSEGLNRLEEDLGRKSMVDPNTLTEFIRYSKKNFPADRNFLILWDHGGGSVTGYGYDEYDKGDTMTLDEIERALFNSDCKFDMIGFDACLMATLETAFIVEPY
ncbi:MAG: peptidase C11, partial [Tissierellales bacterium]|nr:peptidase C11 [Tissierellales bacterium]